MFKLIKMLKSKMVSSLRDKSIPVFQFRAFQRDFLKDTERNS